MNDKSYTGISFPFRVGVTGGVAMSTTTKTDPAHIVDSVVQILNTLEFERTMEHNFFSDVDTSIFDSNDISTGTLIAYQIKDALKRLEPRIKVEDVAITREEEKVYADVTFTVLTYDEVYKTKIEVGEE